MKVVLMQARIVTLFLLLVVVIAACGGSSEPETTPLPTQAPPSATPRSTPLPPVGTVVPQGSAEQPLTLVIVVADASDDSAIENNALLASIFNGETPLDEIIEAAATAEPAEVATEIVEPTATLSSPTIFIESILYENANEAISAVCGQQRAFAWVDAFSYVAALQACGAQPYYIVQHAVELEYLPSAVDVDTTDGLEFDLIYSADLETAPSSLADFAGLTMCRTSVYDPISWVYPTLTLQGAEVNTFTDMAGIVEVEDYAEMLTSIFTSVEDGGCDFGAIPDGSLSALVNIVSDDNEDITRSAFSSFRATWPSVPYGVLIGPSDAVLSAELSEIVMARFGALLQVESFADALQSLQDYESIENADAADLRSFSNWVINSGWAMGS